MTDTRTIMACIDLSDYSPMTLGHGHGLELGTTRRYQGHRLLRLGPDIIHFKKPSLGFSPNQPARNFPKEVPVSEENRREVTFDGVTCVAVNLVEKADFISSGANFSENVFTRPENLRLG